MVATRTILPVYGRPCPPLGLGGVKCARHGERGRGLGQRMEGLELGGAGQPGGPGRPEGREGASWAPGRGSEDQAGGAGGAGGAIGAGTAGEAGELGEAGTCASALACSFFLRV